MRIFRALRRKGSAVRNFLFRFNNKYYRINQEEFKRLSLRYRVASTKFILDYIFCSYIYGCDLRQYMLFEMYKLKHIERKQYVTRYNKFRLFKQFTDDISKRAIFDDKYKFNKAFSDFINRDWIYCPHKSHQSIVAFMQRHGQQFIIKPTEFMGGRGISVSSVNGMEDLQSFARKAVEEKLLLEEVITQCLELAELNASSINTVRLVSIADRNGNTHLVSAALRIGRPGSILDNLSAGGVLYPIDIEEGCVVGEGVDGEGSRYICHEGNIVPGFRIPKWKQVVEVTHRAMKIVPEIRLVAWDLAVTKNGVELIEGNLLPGARSLQADKQGRKEHIKSLI